MPHIPEFSDTTPVQLHYLPPWFVPALFAAAFLGLVALTAVLGAEATVRLGTPDRLREAET